MQIQQEEEIGLAPIGGNADDDDEVVQDGQNSGQERRDPSAPPVFFELDDFIVNLLPDPPPCSDESSSFLLVKIVLELDTPEADARIKALMPRIRNSLTVLLSNKFAKALVTREGKDVLAAEIMNEINGIIALPVKGKRQPGAVVSVLFTSFLIQ